MSEQQVWVAYVTASQQFHIAVPFTEGMSAFDAIRLSGISDQVELPETLSLGIFGIKIDSAAHLLQAGDRVELYRQLTVNPKDIRRLRAQKNPVGRYQRSNRLRHLL